MWGLWRAPWPCSSGSAQSARGRRDTGSSWLALAITGGITPEIALPYNVTGPAGEPDTSYLIRVQGGELHHGRIYGLTLWGGSPGATPAGTGAVVTRIFPDSPAATTFHPGDLITTVNGAPVSTWADVLEQMTPAARTRAWAVRPWARP